MCHLDAVRLIKKETNISRQLSFIPARIGCMRRECTQRDMHAQLGQSL